MGPIKLKHNMAYYGANGGVNNSDIRPQDMVVEASTFAHDSLGVDFSPYDNNHDGQVDFVYVYYAGYAESYGAATYTIWPHASNLTQQGVYASFDGVVLDRYACSSELRYTTGTEIEGIGTFCHEFGHVLGLPDMYDTMYSAETLGAWDLMCSGSYCNDSRTPPGFSAYERSTVGWMELQTIDTPADSLPLHELQASKEAVLDFVNKHVGKQSKVGGVEVVKDPFEKTATQKIRRFKYKDVHGDDVQVEEEHKKHEENEE